MTSQSADDVSADQQQAEESGDNTAAEGGEQQVEEPLQLDAAPTDDIGKYMCTSYDGGFVH